MQQKSAIHTLLCFHDDDLTQHQVINYATRAITYDNINFFNIIQCQVQMMAGTNDYTKVVQ